MRHVAFTALLTALACAVPAAAQAPVLNLPLRARLGDCQTGPQPADRYVVFVGQMPALQGTDHMSMRFDLYERPHGTGPWLPVVEVPKFGVWERSEQHQSGFIYTKRVDQLQAPAAYRALVRFRWYDAQGRLQRAARRITATCRQPDLRPDLVVGGVTATDAGAGQLRYLVRVLNAGRSVAAAFDTVLTVNGSAQPPVTAPALAAGAVAHVAVVAPRCAPGSTIRVALDPSNVIDESHERNNVAVRPCPAP